MSKIIFSLLILLNSAISLAQTNSIIIPTEPVEQVILHTDRDLYLSGEKIWFNAECYLTNENSGFNLSNILYIELYNHNKVYISKKKFKITNGAAYGSIDIPEIFASGNYFLRAYTQFEKNYHPGHFYTSIITILNPLTPLEEGSSTTLNADINIIPENGILVNGIASKIAYQIPANRSSNIEKMTITDSNKQKAADIIRINDKQGYFTLSTDKNLNYNLNLFYSNGDTIVQALPDSKESGLLLKTNTDFDDYVVVDIIQCQSLLEKNKAQEFTLQIKSSNLHTYVDQKIALEKLKNNLVFPTNELGYGLHYILLMDKEEKIIGISSVYISSEEVKLKVSTSKEVYKPRDLVKLNIEPEIFKYKDEYNVSISVVKKGTSNEKNLLLNYATQNPQLSISYMDSHNLGSILTKQEQNFLMILLNKNLSVNGFYNQLISSETKTLKWFPEIRDVSISGLVLNKISGEVVSDVAVFASVFKEHPQFHISKTNENGEFIFSLNNYVRNQDVCLLAESPPLSNFEIRVNNDFSKDFPQIKDVALNIDTTQKSLYEEMYINHQAGKSFKTEIGTKELGVSHFPFSFSDPQTTIIMDDYIKPPDLETAIKELFPDVKIHKSKGRYSMSIKNYKDMKIYHSPLVMVDNIPITDIKELLTVPINNIVSVEVHKEPIILGDNFIKGVFRVITNTKDFGGISIPKGSVFLEYQTISPSYAFDPQHYSSNDKRSNTIADFRNLLYWEPHIKLKEKNTISFYTSDHCSDYDIIIKGNNKKGKTFYKKYSLKVSK